jgi:long-chain acyl-CoA synthetase
MNDVVGGHPGCFVPFLAATRPAVRVYNAGICITYLEDYPTMVSQVQLHEIMRAALHRDPRTRAIEFQGQWYPWGWLKTLADTLDEALNGAGVGPDQPVGVIPRNRPAFAAALLSLIATRRTIVMIYAFQSAEAMADDIRRLRLPAVLADEQDWSAATIGAARELSCLGLSINGASDTVTPLPGLERSCGKGLRGRAMEPAIEMLTSGTTGAPKRLALSFAMIARAMVGENSENAKEFPDASQLAPALLMFPFGNISGLYSYFPMAAGGRPVVLLEKFSVGQWWDFLKRFRPTQMNLPPAGVRMVLDAAIPKEDLACLQYISSGAAWLDPNVQAEFQRRYDIPILLSYGATEFGGVVAAMTLELYKQFGDAKINSVGRPWARTQLRVVDAQTGRPLPAGDTGILEILTPRCGPEWVRTTDLASIDGDGFMYHRGRADGAIMRGGYKIIPEAVAEKIALHPCIAAVAVVGLPDERLGEIPVAAIELRPGYERPTEAELEQHARRHLYSTHVPAAFRIVESLPRTPSMKINLPGVRQLFEDFAVGAKSSESDRIATQRSRPRDNRP